ncbi:hypothetical protein GCM10023094_10760 [Rhodococcus olei]|uniref:DUF4333 domain-containing protein n=1 Tax=Rhodococcus olei TaxID=2161675 RepID=A0ABP8NWB9_9NOCA
MSGPGTNDTENGRTGSDQQAAAPDAAPPQPTVAMPQQPYPQWGQQAWSAQPQYGQQPQPYGQQPSHYGQPPQYGQQPPQYAPQPGYPQQPYPYPQQRQYPQPGYPQPPSGEFTQAGPPPQYGPPPGYPQAQYPQPHHPQPPAAPKSRRPLWIGLGVGAVLVIAAIVAVVVLGGSKTLDRTAAQQGVTQVLTESYGLTGVADVTCPAGRKVEQGATFTCTLTVKGQPQQVTVTFTDDDGTYEVSRPTAR